jgi:glc operon protein GlcG
MPPTLKPLVCLTLLAFAIAPAPALGQGGEPPVIDGAGMFSKEAVNEAIGSLSRIKREYGQAVTVETVDSLRGEGVDEFAVRRAEQLGHQGIFILIARKDRKVDVLASPRSLRETLGVPRLNSIRDAMTEQFGKSQVDAGLMKGIEAAETALAAIRPTRRFEGYPGVPSTTTAASPAASPVASPASASPLVLRQQVRLTLAGARKAIAGAEARAAEKGYKMNIAAVDDGGHLLAFARMDGARPASVATATTKAVTAATFRQPTGPLPVGKEPDLLLNLSVQNATGGKVTTLLGGLPIVVDGQVIGALGVGGGTGDQDAEVAKAGVDAFLAGLQEGTRDRDGEPRSR